MRNTRLITIALMLTIAFVLIPVSSPASPNTMSTDTEISITTIKNSLELSPAISQTNTPIIISAEAFGEPTYTSSTDGVQRGEEIKRILAKYSPISMYIIKNRANGRSVNDLISRWCLDLNGIYGDLDMAVHEEYHGFQLVMEGSQHIADDSVVIISFSRDNIIKTEEATSKIPESLRTSRWDTYVSPGADLTANMQGAYGLLDELGAYYFGCKAVIDSTDYLFKYIEINGYSYELVSGYFCSIENNIQAFYEFYYWTLEYLLFIKEHYPEQYRSIMNNGNYRKTFRYLHDNFIIIENDSAPKNKTAVIDMLNRMNIRAGEDENTIWLKNIGIMKPTAEIEMLKMELCKDNYILMLNELINPLSTPASSPLPTSPTIKPSIPTITVNPTTSTVYVNGEEKFFEAYLIDGSNYFKLRDLAFVLSDTDKQFNVWYDETTKAVTLTSGQPYIQLGGEMTRGDGNAKTARPTPSKIYLGEKELNFTVYNIGGNNFFKLRDLMSALDIGVTYNAATGNIDIETYLHYLE